MGQQYEIGGGDVNPLDKLEELDAEIKRAVVNEDYVLADNLRYFYHKKSTRIIAGLIVASVVTSITWAMGGFS